MNQTTKSILLELTQIGQAVILHSRLRDCHAAQDLIDAGICHRSSSNHGFYIIKFGRKPVTI
jgi:hypothetical protein